MEAFFDLAHRLLRIFLAYLLGYQGRDYQGNMTHHHLSYMRLTGFLSRQLLGNPEALLGIPGRFLVPLYLLSRTPQGIGDRVIYGGTISVYHQLGFAMAGQLKKLFKSCS
jgi:hypothetical protein